MPTIIMKKGMEAAMEWSQFLYETTSPQLSELFSLFDPGMDSDDVTAYDAFHAMSQTDIDNFINSGTVSMLDGNQEEKLEMIINQKMLSYFPSMVYEGYADWRRTGYPRVLVGDDTGELQGVAPRRYLYPKYEQDLNEDSYDEVIQRIGSDHMHTKMWWDTNPDSPHMHPGEVEWREEPWIQ